MDLGIRGMTAIVCASSKGLGKACAQSLAAEGVNVVINGRSCLTLEKAAEEIRDASRDGASVTPVCADVTTALGREQLLAACPAPDILVNNAGGPAPGNFRDWGEEEWLGAINANMLTPISLIKATVDAMAGNGFGRIVNITSAAVKAPISVLGLSNGARSGLTGFVAGVAREVAASGVTINNMLPGVFATDRLPGVMGYAAKSSGKTVEQVTELRRNAIPVKRFGDPMEFGQLCAFLCSRQAGYLTAQNIVIDGGAFPGSL